uniref:Acyltransferase n=1 Tax=Chromera velia CCMP2878 TaxID=1169474 RepID=A0A0G4HIA4_9ALVE|eukprot:Cvel_6932.t1-p1 / transcript=Cvel_6932.t1 / gene=Cvel_6932 / organism=Chromera_velia_CCMP2878 / gene_product=Diacylglycerol O-acyltransferase 2B, putative / transcript_product=Diacylglycerol O-acyltransferase 2B, putative / location=Cvel_scaffold351:18750-19928(-) / protein_length=393 / sequence_SO=supercontig / SO=protein_coding / is_pseudo=false
MAGTGAEDKVTGKELSEKRPWRALSTLLASGVVAIVTWFPLAALIFTVLLAWSPVSRKFRLLRVRGVPSGRVALLAYLGWLFLDRSTPANGGRPVQWLRSQAMMTWFRKFFPCTLVKAFNGPLDSTRRFVVACHPHGVMGIGVWAHFMLEGGALPGIDYRVLTLSENFRIPFWRDWLLSLGFVDCSRSSVSRLLKGGTSVVVVVGGAREALDARPGTNDLTLSSRFGFVRIAMESGASLIPVFSFGETDTFTQLLPNPPGSRLRALQEKLLSIYGYSVPIVMGSRGLPRRTPILTVVGEPVEVPHVPEGPSPEQLKAAHAKYVSALKALYEAHAASFYHPNPVPELRIVDEDRGEGEGANFDSVEVDRDWAHPGGGPGAKQREGGPAVTAARL